MRVLWAFVLSFLLLCATASAADRLHDQIVDLHLLPLDGQPAPPFALAGLDGVRISLADLKDRVVFLYFWATW